MDLEFITKTIISLLALSIEQIVTFAIFIIVLLVATFIFAKKHGQADSLQYHKTDAQCALYKAEMEKIGILYLRLQISFHGDKPIFISCPYCNKKKCSINQKRCKFL